MVTADQAETLRTTLDVEGLLKISSAPDKAACISALQDALGMKA